MRKHRIPYTNASVARGRTFELCARRYGLYFARRAVSMVTGVSGLLHRYLCRIALGSTRVLWFVCQKTRPRTSLSRLVCASSRLS